MAYLIIEDFKGGLDVRKSAFTAPPGSLRVLDNAHLTRGGEIEKRKALVEFGTLPADTFGLHAVLGELYVFGTIAPPDDMPTGVNYQQLVLDTPGPTITRIVSATNFRGKIQVLAKFSDDSYHMFYDGAEVTDFRTTHLSANEVPTAIKTFQDRVYATIDSVLAGSGYDGVDPDSTVWTLSGTDAVSIDLSLKDENASELIGLGVYQDQIAVFSRRSVQVWDVDPDPEKIFLYQTLNWVGCCAANTIVSLGEVDLFFLSDTGIRSLRAHNVANLASTQDVGTAIDPEVIAWMRTLSADEIASAVAAVEPADGRVLLAIGSRVYVFTHFPGSKVTAWSTYSFGVTITAFASVGTRLYARAGDTVYLYGGEDGETYDDSAVLAKLPFHDAGTPATQKDLTGIDLGCEGTWSVAVALNPDDPSTEETLAASVGSTYGTKQRYDAQGQSTHFSLIFRHEADGPALMANAVLHYQPGEAG